MKPRSSWVIVALVGLAVSATASATRSAQLQPTEGSASTSTLGQISDIRFDGKTSLDSGLDVGFLTELHVDQPVCAATGSVCAHQTGIDDVYISVNGRAGTIGLVRAGGGDVALSGLAVPMDNQTLSYRTPQYGGVQLAVTLTQRNSPVLPGLQLGVLTPRDRADLDSSTLGLGANYTVAFKRVTLSLSGTHMAVRNTPATVILPETSLRWGAGASVAYGLPHGRGALVLSGSVRDLTTIGLAGGHPADLDDTTRWDAELSYAKGPFSLGGTISDRSYGAQAGYRFRPGLQVAGGVVFWNDLPDDYLPMGLDHLRDTHSTVLFIETALDF